jgi:hypothetical protein
MDCTPGAHPDNPAARQGTAPPELWIGLSPATSSLRCASPSPHSNVPAGPSASSGSALRPALDLEIPLCHLARTYQQPPPPPQQNASSGRDLSSALTPVTSANEYYVARRTFRFERRKRWTSWAVETVAKAFARCRHLVLPDFPRRDKSAGSVRGLLRSVRVDLVRVRSPGGKMPAARRRGARCGRD